MENLQRLLRSEKGIVLSYVSIHGEIDPTAAEKSFAGLYFPRILRDKNLIEFREVKSRSDLQKASWNLEPPLSAPLLPGKVFGIVFVPAVAFDHSGHRLGFGSGHFDRFLQAHPHLLRIGLAHDFQILPKASWLVEKHDEIMDYVVTPSAIWGSPRIGLRHV